MVMQLLNFGSAVGHAALDENSAYLPFPLMRAAKAVMEPRTILRCACGGTLQLEPALRGVGNALYWPPSPGSASRLWGNGHLGTFFERSFSSKCTRTHTHTHTHTRTHTDMMLTYVYVCHNL